MGIVDWNNVDCNAMVQTEVGKVPALQGFECVFKAVLITSTQLAVILLFLLLIAGGFKYMTAGGDPKATASASGTLTYAILGIVLLIVIWLIFQFLKDFTGVDLSTFTIPTQ